MAAANVIESPSLSQELRAAVTSAYMSDYGSSREVRLANSDLPSMVPSASALSVTAVKLTDLKMGDIICVRIGATFAVRRFVKTKITPKTTLILTTYEGFAKKEALTRNHLLGKVEEVEFQGQSFDPLRKESFLDRFLGKLTEYGTHKPFGIFSAQ